LPLVEQASESVRETRLRLLFQAAGLPVPVVQFEVRGAGGRFVARLDLAWPELKVAAEYDGDHHREQAQFRRDVARLNALRESGWVVLRFTADDLDEHPDRTVQQMTRALHEAKVVAHTSIGHPDARVRYHYSSPPADRSREW
jgi:hypothetical protein